MAFHIKKHLKDFYLSSLKSSLISESWQALPVRSSLTFDTSPPSPTPTASAGAGIKRRVAVLRCPIDVRRERTRISYLVQTSVLIFLFNVTVGLRRLCQKIVKLMELKFVSVITYLLCN